MCVQLWAYLYNILCYTLTQYYATYSIYQGCPPIFDNSRKELPREYSQPISPIIWLCLVKNAEFTHLKVVHCRWLVDIDTLLQYFITNTAIPVNICTYVPTLSVLLMPLHQAGGRRVLGYRFWISLQCLWLNRLRKYVCQLPTTDDSWSRLSQDYGYTIRCWYIPASACISHQTHKVEMSRTTDTHLADTLWLNSII